MKNQLPIIAAILEISSVVPYMVDMLRGKTRPNIVSWASWGVLAYIDALALYSEHSNQAATLALSSAIAFTAVIMLGIRFGFAKFGKFDIACIVGAIIACILWILFKSAKVGLFASITVDLVVTAPTVYHSWHRFREETLIAYQLGVTSGVLLLLSLGRFTFIGVVYPLLLIVTDGAVVIGILRGRLRYQTTRNKAAIKAARTRRRNARRKPLRVVSA